MTIEKIEKGVIYWIRGKVRIDIVCLQERVVHSSNYSELGNIGRFKSPTTV